MKVKWHGVNSSTRKLFGGGPQGATFGIWEYLAQSNDNADCVESDYRFKFVDDLTVLEKVNLLITGLASFYSKSSVPSDIPEHNQIIPNYHLKSQEYLDYIQEWTRKQKMILNQKKTKMMIFNFTDNYKFTARLELNSEQLDVVQKAKLLGVIITDDLKWDENTTALVKRANARLELLRKVASFSTAWEDLKCIYILYVRSILEQSCVVWHSSLTEDNSNDLERIQKCALKIILGNKYNNYDDALQELDLQSLKERRKDLCLTFAKKCLKNEKTKSMFPSKVKTHQMELRSEEIFSVEHANTERYLKSAIPYMQRLMNNDEQNKQNGQRNCSRMPG